MKKRILISFLLFTLAVFSAWEVALHRHSVVRAQSSPPDINTYTSIENPTPFTLVTSLTITSPSASNVMHGVETLYVNRYGDILRHEERFGSASATVPGAIISQMNKRSDFEYTEYVKFLDGKVTEVSTARKPHKALLWRHAMPEKNCITPDPGISLLRNETLVINGVSRPTAVVSYHSKQDESPLVKQTMRRSLELGCRVLKSTAYINPAPGGGESYSVLEPVSLTIGEPPAEVFTKHATDVASSESVPLEKWEERMRAETKARSTAAGK